MYNLTTYFPPDSDLRTGTGSVEMVKGCHRKSLPLGPLKKSKETERYLSIKLDGNVHVILRNQIK